MTGDERKLSLLTSLLDSPVLSPHLSVHSVSFRRATSRECIEVAFNILDDVLFVAEAQDVPLEWRESETIQNDR